MKILAILCVKNEGAFLIDWLAHHRAVGFTDFLVFSNDCEDGTDAMLDRLADMGWLTHVPNPGPWDEGPQWAALKAAGRQAAYRTADWAMVLDIDEYVNIHAGDRTIPALLGALPGCDAIALTWRIFGNGGIVDDEDRPVSARFTRAAPAVLHWPWRALMIKTLFRPALFARPGIHRPKGARGEARWSDPGLGNRLFSAPGQNHYRLAQLNHYALGSMESYLVKCDRGRANREAAALDMSYWCDRNFVAEEDRSVLLLNSASLRAELHADPVLSGLHAGAVGWRRARFAALMAQEPWRALFGRLMMTPPARILSREEAEKIRRHRKS